MSFVNIERRRVPWHQGKLLENAEIAARYTSAIDAMHAADLDWDVERVPLYAINDAAPFRVYEKVDDAFGVQRSTDGKVLGVVGSRYRTISNRQLAAATDAIVSTGAGELAGMGEAADGRRVWTAIKLNRDVGLPGHDSEDSEGWLIGQTSHDGSAVLSFQNMVVRLICTNGMKGIVSSNHITVRHTKNWEFKLSHAMRVLRSSDDYFEQYQRIMYRLVETKVPVDQQLNDLVVRLLPIRNPETITIRQQDTIERRRESLRTVIRQTRTIPVFRDTGWGWVNAVAEWDQWHPETQKRRRKPAMDRLLEGNGNYVERARNLVLV